MKKSTKSLIFFTIIVAIIVIILIINSVKSNGNEDESLMKCIAENTKIYVSKTCSHCAEQKRILGDYLDLFDMTDCATEPEICSENGILYVPTWIINEEKHTGVLPISTLKKLTNC